MEQIAINILPKGAKPVCHSSQFDEGRQIRFNLFNDTTPYTLSGTETISVLVRKPDGTEVIDSVTNTSDSYVIWDVSADACEVSGVCECELSIVENGILLGSKNFTMKVEEDAYGGRNIEVRTASGRIATFITNMVEAFKSLKSDINPVQDLHGYSKPWSGGGGKNKLDYLSNLRATDSGLTISATSGGAIHYQGTAINNYCMLTYKFNLSIPSGTTITVSRDVSVGYQHYFDFTFTDNSIEYVRIMPNTTSTTYTLPKDLKNIDIVCLGLTVGTAYNETVKFQLEIGSPATSWTPYENICPISGFSALNVTRTGKNFLKYPFTSTTKTTQGITFTDNGDGTITVNGTATANADFTLYSLNGFTLPQGQYVLSVENMPAGCYVVFGSTAIPYVNVFGSMLPYTFTISNDNPIGYGILRIPSGTTVNNLVFKPMIRVSGTSADYEAYNGQTATVNFGQTVYGGVADVTNGKVVSKMQMLDFANADIYKNSSDPNDYMYYAKLGTTFDKNGDGICSHLTEQSGLPVGSTQGFVINSQYNVVYINVGVLAQNDVAGFKAFCVANDVQLLLELLTPIEITTTPENLTAIVGQNNVYSDTNGDTEVEYYIEV